jgi:acyl-CoA thioesterase FadM
VEITTLSGLIKEGVAVKTLNGIIVEVRPSLIVKGEDRLSYTSLIRIVECAREQHWQHDVCSIDKTVDSICKSFTADFMRPIIVGTKILITYMITLVRKASYHVSFLVCSEDKTQKYASINMIFAFYNPSTQKIILPPHSVITQLAVLKRGTYWMK